MAAVLAGLGAMLVLLPLAAQSNPSATGPSARTTVEHGRDVDGDDQRRRLRPGPAECSRRCLPGFSYVSHAFPEDAQVRALPGNRRQRSPCSAKGPSIHVRPSRHPTRPGTTTFSGTLRYRDGIRKVNDLDIDGAAAVTVEAPAPFTPVRRPQHPTPVPNTHADTNARLPTPEHRWSHGHPVLQRILGDGGRDVDGDDRGRELRRWPAG